ncbi:MAG TPA: hypothetical protein VFK79_17890 [Xanthobacteraceae bacterium]|nr:hypothetical protein [Xanthobacteraceae bacterium]
MRQDFRGGFDPPLRYHERRRQRTALSLFAGLALAISTMIAATIVSIGIAQADILVATRSGDGTLAVAFLICSIIIGAIVGAIYRKRQERPD